MGREGYRIYQNKSVITFFIYFIKAAKVGRDKKSNRGPRTHHARLTEPTDVAYLCPLLLLAVIFCLLALLSPGDLNELELFISKAEELV